jgi:hypothetical protein
MILFRVVVEAICEYGVSFVYLVNIDQMAKGSLFPIRDTPLDNTRKIVLTILNLLVGPNEQI